MLSSFANYDLDDDIFENKDQDYMLALQLQMQYEVAEEAEEKPNKQKEYQSPVKASIPQPINDPQWDLIDPCPDIRAMFQEFDKKYFWSTLGSCIVEWSKRMTICAGIFYLREGGIIRLSEPLLKYRPRKDLVETLLHEMIHAYLYLTRNFKDRGEHGDEFKGHMNRINKLASTSITVYHSFHDEVNYARQHVWRCTGVCRSMAPFYGYVRRSMNRAPGKNDTWWAQHQSKCNGVFEKVAEPESFKTKANNNNNKKSEKTLVKSEPSSAANTSRALLSSQELAKNKKLDNYFKSNSSKSSLLSPTNDAKSKSAASLVKLESNEIKSEIKKRKSADDDLTSKKASKFDKDIVEIKTIKSNTTTKTAAATTSNNDIIILDSDLPAELHSANLVECPICYKKFHSDLINSHVNNHF